MINYALLLSFLSLDSFNALHRDKLTLNPIKNPHKLENNEIKHVDAVVNERHEILPTSRRINETNCCFDLEKFNNITYAILGIIFAISVLVSIPILCWKQRAHLKICCKRKDKRSTIISR